MNTILAMDPGKVNFAWVHWRGEVLDYGWVTPVKDVNNDTEFLNCILELLTRCKPDYVVLERFMARNRGQSIHSESINQMIGRICAITRTHSGMDTIQLTASQWKTWWEKQKKQKWEEVYSSLESVHQRDAAGIAHYTNEVWIPAHLKR